MYVNNGNWYLMSSQDEADELYPIAPSPDFPGGCEHYIADNGEIYARHLSYWQV